VAKGYRSSIDIYEFWIEICLLDNCQRLGCKSFVKFNKLNLLQAQSRLSLGIAAQGPIPMIVSPQYRRIPAGRWAGPRAFIRSSHDHHKCSTVRGLRGIASRDRAIHAEYHGPGKRLDGSLPHAFVGDDITFLNFLSCSTDVRNQHRND
jgi:hypothetical protein